MQFIAILLSAVSYSLMRGRCPDLLNSCSYLVQTWVQLRYRQEIEALLQALNSLKLQSRQQYTAVKAPVLLVALLMSRLRLAANRVGEFRSKSQIFQRQSQQLLLMKSQVEVTQHLHMLTTITNIWVLICCTSKNCLLGLGFRWIQHIVYVVYVVWCCLE